MKLDNFDFDFIPEQHERDQIHVWYTTHPMGGLNKEGNVLLIPTAKFKEQMHEIKFLRDYKDINRTVSPLKRPRDSFLVITTNMTMDEQVHFILDKVNNTRKTNDKQRRK